MELVTYARFCPEFRTYCGFHGSIFTALHNLAITALRLVCASKSPRGYATTTETRIGH